MWIQKLWLEGHWCFLWWKPKESNWRRPLRVKLSMSNQSQWLPKIWWWRYFLQSWILNRFSALESHLTVNKSTVFSLIWWLWRETTDLNKGYQKKDPVIISANREGLKIAQCTELSPFIKNSLNVQVGTFCNEQIPENVQSAVWILNSGRKNLHSWVSYVVVAQVQLFEMRWVAAQSWGQRSTTFICDLTTWQPENRM